MSNFNTLRNFLLATSTIALGTLNLAHAQEAGDGNEVVVTGTRLNAAGFQAPTPVTVLGGEQLEQRAPTTIAEVVNELPSMRQSATSTQNQRGNGGGGQQGVDLRGLGRNRTLVLVDGKRFTPTNLNGTIDINHIPTLMVDRVEVVTGGASAAYGSDAVSGVVNFVLKKSIEGVQGNVQYGVSSRSDYEEPAFSLATGHGFADGKGQFLIGGEFSDNRGVGTIYTRDWGRKQVSAINFGAARPAGTPANGLVENVTYSQQTDGSIILNSAANGSLAGTAFGPGGTPFRVTFGQIYSNIMVGGDNGNRDGNSNGNWNLSAPHKRYNGMSKLSYDFNENLSGFVQWNYGHQENFQTITYHQTPNLIINATNPYIPAAIRTAMLTAGPGGTALTRITVGRYDTELGGYLFKAWDTTQRGVAGLNGNVAGWDWEAYYAHGVQNGASLLSTNIYEGNWLAATNVVTDANGVPVCGPLATNPNLNGTNTQIANAAIRLAQVEPGCVPFNIFGRGSASEQAKEYIKGESNTHSRYQQNVVAFSVSGEPFELPAGPVSTAFGIEHREEEGSSLQNAFGASQGIGSGLSNNGSTYSGAYDVTEGFAEVGAPLIKDQAFFKALDVNAAVRRTNYSTSGNVTTWKVGGTWEPNDLLRFRVTRSRDIRAPGINDLFASGARGITAGTTNPINGASGALFTQGGGNPNLKPEEADTWTAGVVVQNLSFLEGFRASVDYYKVEINDVISSVSAANILLRCAQKLAGYCDLIDFDSTPFGIALVHTSPANLDKLETEGLDIEMAYRVPIDRLGLPGRLNVRSLTTLVPVLTTTDAVSAFNRAGSGAGGGVPKVTSNLNVSYQAGRVNNTLMFRYTSPIKYDATLYGPDDPNDYNPAAANSTNARRYPGIVYVNWSTSVDILQGEERTLQAFFNVNNVLDRDPPSTSWIALSSGGNPYDLIGRAYKAGLRFKF